MPTRSVELTEHFEEFITASVSSGRFGDANETVEQGLRLLEEREREDAAKLEWLRAAVKEGFDAIDRSDYVTVNSAEELTALIDGIYDEALAELAVACKSA